MSAGRLLRGLAAPALAALTVSAAVPARADTRFEGEYQIQLDIRKQDRAFPWDYDYNSDDSFGLAQFRIIAQPRDEVEAFLKFEADWNRANNNGRRPEFQYRESHLRFGWDRGGRGIETWVFSRQDRFWVENHLIRVVEGGKLNDGGNAQGVRLNVYNWLRGANFSYIYSDFSGQATPDRNPDPTQPAGTDDAHIFRARRDFFGNVMRAGLTYGRKVESGLGDIGHTEIFHGDLRLTRGNTSFLIEYAESNQDPLGDSADGSFTAPSGRTFFRPHEWLPSDATLRAEIRAITIGTPWAGYFNVAPSYWFAGPDYENPLGDSLKDEHGFWINSWYLVPARALTLSVNYGEWKREVFEQKDNRELYVELYTEYVNGFTSKFFFRSRRTDDYSNPLFVQEFQNDDLFAEVQVESRLARMRIQGKIKNIGSDLQKELASLDTTVNLTRSLKVFSRFTFGNDPARLRDSFFAELQYRPRPGMEMFLSYGPWWIGDSNNPVDDGDLEGNAENRDIIKFILKGFF